MTQRTFPVTVMRGGTSRGLFFHEADLPSDPEIRDRVLLQAIGSPDPYGRQINGLGGATSSTSKIVIVRKSSRPGIDVDYTFGQVNITKPIIDYSGNCGNLSSAVGPFALNEGLISTSNDETTVQIYNTNTDKQIEARFRVTGGVAAVDGDYEIDGVPGTGDRIALRYLNPGGAVTGHLLPSGSVRDEINVEGVGRLEVSIVDAANPVVFTHARNLGITATEHPDTLNGMTRTLEILENLRHAASQHIGYQDETPESIRVAVVAEPVTYSSSRGAAIDGSSIHLVGRIISAGKAHHAFTATGAICTAVAARINGTIPNEVMGNRATITDSSIVLGHAAGTIEIGVELDDSHNGPVANAVTTFRTARRLLRGEIYVPESLF